MGEKKRPKSIDAFSILVRVRSSYEITLPVKGGAQGRWFNPVVKAAINCGAKLCRRFDIHNVVPFFLEASVPSSLQVPKYVLEASGISATDGKSSSLIDLKSTGPGGQHQQAVYQELFFLLFRFQAGSVKVTQVIVVAIGPVQSFDPLQNTVDHDLTQTQIVGRIA